MSNEVKVGDVMILVRSYGLPETVNIHRVTPSGQVTFLDENGVESRRFKRDWPDAVNYRPVKQGYSRFSCQLYVYSDEKLAELRQVAEEHAVAQAEKKVAEEKRQAEIAAANAAERAELKKAVGGSIIAVSSLRVLPDGSRLYTVTLPVKECYAERKKNFEVAIVRCWDEKRYSWQGNSEDGVKFAMTYCNGDCVSFSSCSTEFAVNDEVALWSTATYLYHRW
jgi:hypothetical protein